MIKQRIIGFILLIPAIYSVIYCCYVSQLCRNLIFALLVLIATIVGIFLFAESFRRCHKSGEPYRKAEKGFVSRIGGL